MPSDAQVTEHLLRFSTSQLSLKDYTEQYGIDRSSFHKWTKGTLQPKGLAGLTDTQKQVLESRLTHIAARATPEEVTDFLRSYLRTERISLQEYADFRKKTYTRVREWATGKKVPEGLAGLTPGEREKLAARLIENRKPKPHTLTLPNGQLPPLADVLASLERPLSRNATAVPPATQGQPGALGSPAMAAAAANSAHPHTPSDTSPSRRLPPLPHHDPQPDSLSRYSAGRGPGR
ncbi:hypothetical protein ACFC09_27090 [Streptomyces sp. NPDC056161]|uniref:hypothetical protein n=1 Tax=Streptomyces sp. NPDC056161 TaxID=3345732 RepID=UPI0035DA376F